MSYSNLLMPGLRDLWVGRDVALKMKVPVGHESSSPTAVLFLNDQQVKNLGSVVSEVNVSSAHSCLLSRINRAVSWSKAA